MEFLRQTATADVVSNRIGFVPRPSSVSVTVFSIAPRREDAMSMHERLSGEYSTTSKFYRSYRRCLMDTAMKRRWRASAGGAIESTGLC